MNELKNINWLKIISFYLVILITTYLARKLPNLLRSFLGIFTEIHFPWNFNHGFAILIVTALFYKFYSPKKSELSILGNNKLKSLIFPIVLIVGYTLYGFKNDQGINEHLWAFIFCLFTLVYDLMEEYT